MMESLTKLNCPCLPYENEGNECKAFERKSDGLEYHGKHDEACARDAGGADGGKGCLLYTSFHKAADELLRKNFPIFSER